jgi:tetratricopeptide (TPR) repeat protein
MKVLLFFITFPFLLWSSEFTEANSLFHQGMFEEAIQTYNHYLQDNPTDAHAWYNKGLAHQQLNELPKASFSFEKAFHIDPNEQKIQESLVSVYEQSSIPESWQNPLNSIELKLFRITGFSWIILTICLSMITSFLLYGWIKGRKKSKLAMSVITLFLAVFAIVNFQKKQTWLSGEGFAIIANETEKIYTTESGNEISNEKPSAFGIIPGKRVNIGSVGKRVEVFINEQEHVWLDKEDVFLLNH